ncbi:hypothetical protein Tco_1388808 [Tanacetum coccineum]
MKHQRFDIGFMGLSCIEVQDSCSTSAIDQNLIFENRRLTKRVFVDDVAKRRHTTVGEGRPDAGADHSIFAGDFVDDALMRQLALIR